MLAKNRTSALILTIMFSLGSAAGFVIVDYPLLFIPTPLPSTPSLLLAGFLGAMLIFSLSRSEVVMGLSDQEGFRWRGLLRWLSCGIVSGLLAALLNLKLLPPINDRSFFRPILELAGYAAILYISYWIAFRRNIYQMLQSNPAQSLSNLLVDMFFIGGGLLVAAACGLVAYYRGGHNPPLFWMSLGGACIAISLALMGLLLREKRRPHLRRWLGWGILGMIGLGLVLVISGLLL